uniref:aldehyde dehydrogenase family protein n=1 Tax=Arthrobacter sp. TaxID=1667 RepID=UPI000EB74C01|nr:aldehyde dehydrogenase family protein [Arthrobacter sp.]AXV46635.1 aldehyde dehydrogenaseproduct [Arthrobacter sp.]
MTDTLTCINPATGETLGSVPVSTPRDVDRACRKAQLAFDGEWSRNSRMRSDFLRSWADNIEQRRDEVAAMLTAETGKVRRESESEVALTVEALRFNSPLSRLVSGTTHELPDGSVGHVMRQPAGVSAFIIPWNWPIFLLFRDLAPALAAGVTAVVKPAPQTPLSLGLVLEAMPELEHEVVLSVPGGAETGSALTDHELVKVVAFTGSTHVGKTVAEAASRRFAKPVLELGGKGTSILAADANVDAALTACIQSGFLTSGQMCMANSRLLVHTSIYSTVVEELAERIATLTVGDPTDAATDMGPVISKQHGSLVQRFMDLARAEGQVIVGGGPATGIGLDGAYLQPTLVAAPLVDPRISTQEIFGPVVSVEAFDDIEDAVLRANDTQYGLSAAIWTQDSATAWSAARNLDFGTVWVNRYNRTFAETPSGGMKASGTGRSRGFEGINEFTELKHVNWEA